MLLRRILLVFTVLMTAVLWNAPAWAQAQAKITGVVRDATGAALPGATVTATHLTSSTSRTATTGVDGSYSIALPPGAYTVSVSLAGFRRGSRGVEVPETGATADFSLDAQLSEEVTVTAMKRETTIIDTPFSIAAPTEELLKMRGVEDIEGLAANVAGFTVQNLGPGQSQVAVRGVSAGQIVRDQPGVKEQVGIYLDESVISMSLFTPDVDLFDVSRVEVLRGPQGTLFGSGSLSGTVRYITNQPELGVTSGVAELGANFIGGGGPGASAKVAYNFPVGEKAAARVAGYYTHIGGYIDSVRPDLSVEDNVNDGFRTGFRAAAKFVPNERLTVTPRLLYQKVDMNGWNRHDAYNILGNPFTTTRPPVTLDDREQFTQLQEEFSDNFVLADLNLTYGLGDMTLTSITSYIYRDVLVKRDATALTASITGGSIGLPENVFALDAPLFDATTANAWSQEVRLSGRREAFHWVGGLFYSHAARDYGQSLPVNGFQDLTGIPTIGLRAPKDVLFFSDLDYSLNQFGLFGEATYEFTPEFSLTGGLRYYHFGEDKEQIFDGIFAHNDTGTAVVSQPGDTSADGVAPRIIASYKLAPTTYLNAQVSKGFRLGGINDPLNVPLCTPQDLVTFGGRETWDDEKAWNYEAGVKTRVLNGLGALNVSGFYMDISDLQATVTAGSCSSRVVFNVPKARVDGRRDRVRGGADPELRLRPLDRHQQFATRIDAHLDRPQRRRQHRVGDRGRPPPADGAGVPVRRRGDLPVGSAAGVPVLRDGLVPAHRRAVHAGRRRGSRHAQPAVLRRQHDWRAVDLVRVRLRSRAAGLRHPEPAGRIAPESVGHRDIPEQPDRRKGVPVVRSGTRNTCADRLRDEPAAHIWDLYAV